MINRFLLAFMLSMSMCTEAFSFYSVSDTTRIATDLDSAFKIMKRADPQSVRFLSGLLKDSRIQEFKRGEAEALFCLGEYYYITEKAELSWQYFDSARIAFEALPPHKGRWAQSLNMLGSIKMRDREYIQAIPYFEKAAVINKEVGRKQNLGDCYYNLANIHTALGDYVKSIEYFLEVMKIDEELGYMEGLADDYGRISSIYEKIGDLPRARESHMKSIGLSEKSGDKSAMSASFMHYGLFLKNIGKYDESRKALQKSLDISNELKSDRQIAISLHNMGALNFAEGKYNEAIRIYSQSLALKIGTVEPANQEGLAQAYFKLKDYAQATTFATLALRSVTESKFVDHQQKLFLLLSEINQAQGNYKVSLEYYKQYTTLKDSLLNNEKTQQIKVIQARHETETKEKEIETLTQERQLQDDNLRQKTFVQYALISSVVMLIGFGLITFRIFRSRQEARRELLAQQLKTEHQETQRVRELDRMKSRFFANIAHEFRTPLTLILGPLENIISKPQQPGVPEQLVLVKNNASRLVKLVNQLLDLSKLESGTVKLEYVQEDVIPFLKSLAFAFQSLADQKNISIHFTTDTATVFTRFDRDKLEKIFSNLLSNAFKFTPKGGKVTMNVQVKHLQLIVQVSDSGTGISDDDMPYIFNRFYQSETATRSTTGSGIGLELTRELVVICGGSIQVANIPLGGAQFTVTLPVISEQITADEKGQLHTSMYTAETSAVASAREEVPAEEGRDTILVIEDNQEVRDFIVQSLRDKYNVSTAEHGGEGIHKAITNIPDLVITDVMMPVKDGLEVSRTLKQAQESSHIPIIMLTAKADVESKIEGLETGADDYLAKPFSTRELLTRIQNLIENRKLLREKFSTGIAEQPKAEVAEELPPREKQFLNRLHEAIERHLAEEEYGVEELSRDMAMSRMQLHRKMKAVTDTTPSLYIRSLRLERGKRLLEEGLYNVSEVAYRVGFNSPTYFSTCFSERFGFPPSDIKPVNRK